MRLASYIARGRTSFGAVLGDGVVDFRVRFGSRFASLVDLIRADALDEARAVLAGVRPDFKLAEIALLPPLLTPEKILCIGINYANRNADFDDPNVPKYPSMFYRHPGSFVGAGQPLVRPKVSEQLDYEGEIAMVIGREGRHVPKGLARDYILGYTLCNEGTVRDWLRHGKFNVTQGKNFDKSGSLGPFIVTTDEIDPAKPMHLTAKVNGEVTGRRYVEHDLLVHRPHRLHHHLHDPQAGRHRHRRHAGQEGPAHRPATLAQGRRRGGNLLPRARHAAQRGGR